MATARVQSVQGIWASGTTFSASITTTSGNLLALSIHFLAGNSANAIVGVGDGTNTYSLVDEYAAAVAGLNNHLRTYYAQNITGGALTLTVTLSSSSVSYAWINVDEVSGADTTAPLDQHVIQNQDSPGTGADAVTSGAVTTTANGEYVYGATLMASANPTITAGTGFTQTYTTSPSFNADGTAERLIQTSAGSIAATFTISADARAFTAIATFKAAAAGAGMPTLVGPRFALAGRRGLAG